jgi:hypothetical protein
MKQPGKLLVLSLLAVAFGLITSHVVPELSKAQSQGERLAFTAVIKTTAFDPNGGEHASEIVVYANRSDGSRAEWTQKFKPPNTGKPYAENRSVLDLVGLRDVGIDPFTESVSSSPIEPSRVLKYRMKPDSTCALPIAEGNRLVIDPPPVWLQGRPTVHVSGKTSLRDGSTLTVEEWRAPELECFPIKQTAIRLATKDGMTYSSRIEKEVTQVTIGDPDPALFAIPAQYTERSPSEIMAEAARRRGKPNCDNCNSKTAAMLDDAYRKRKGGR